MNYSSRLFIVALMILMVSCGKQIPGDVIQPVDMENLLYDYHLALTMGNDLGYEDRYKRELYKDYIFQKHGVTEAQFDSSMVWYTRNSKELTEIYKKLQKRFEIDEEHMRSQLNRRSGQIEVSLSGDSVDVWSDRDLYWLTSSPLTNRLVFDLKADTTFHADDALVFSADLNFLSPDKAYPKVVAALNVIFKNDSTQSVTKVMDNSGYYELPLVPDSALEYKSVNGFIYFSNSDSLDASALIRNIKLMRYRKESYNPANGTAVSDEKQTKTADDKAVGNINTADDKKTVENNKSTGEKKEVPRISDRNVRTRELNKVEMKKIDE